MSITSYFTGIEDQIFERINQAEKQVLVASAWFSNVRLANALLEKKRQGVHVEILVSAKENALGDDIPKYALNQPNRSLREVLVGNSGYSMMHNKFCVIDYQTVITGSYNWTNNANKSQENIVVIEDKAIAKQYSNSFNMLRALAMQNEQEESIIFYTTTNLVDVNIPVDLYWSVPHANYIELNGEVYWNITGNSSLLIMDSTTFVLEAFDEDGESLGVKSLYVECQNRPTIDYTIEVYDSSGSQFLDLEAYRYAADAYVLPFGSKLVFRWDVEHAATVSIDGVAYGEVELSGEETLYPKGKNSYVIRAQNPLHSESRTIQVEAMEVPKIKRLPLPFPEHISSAVNVDMRLAKIPDNALRTNTISSINMPNLTSLEHSVTAFKRSQVDRMLYSFEQSYKELNKRIGSINKFEVEDKNK